MLTLDTYVEEDVRDEMLDPIRKNKSNVCFDCNSSNPKWASATLGVFVCVNCAGTHRNLGVHISFIRSIDFDSWK